MKEDLNLGNPDHPRKGQEQETVPIAAILIPKHGYYDEHLLNGIRGEEEAAPVLSDKDSQRIVNQKDDSDKLFYDDKLVRHTREPELITLRTRGKILLFVEAGAYVVF